MPLGPTFDHRHLAARAVALGVLASLTLGAGCSGDESCGDCVDEKCADLVSVCRADDDCACMADCLASEGVPGVAGCLDACELAERPTPFAPVEECVAVACPDTDECSTPDDWSPPETTSTLAATTTEDIGGGELPNCQFDPGMAFDPDGTVLQLETTDESICVRIERRNDGAGSLANTTWTLLDVRVGPLGTVAHVDDAAALCWYSSHHNFADWAHVWTGSTHHDIAFKAEGHGGKRTYELHTYAQGPLGGTCAPSTDGSDPIGPPVELVPFSP